MIHSKSFESIYIYIVKCPSMLLFYFPRHHNPLFWTVFGLLLSLLVFWVFLGGRVGVEGKRCVPMISFKFCFYRSGLSHQEIG